MISRYPEQHRKRRGSCYNQLLTNYPEARNCRGLHNVQFHFEETADRLSSDSHQNTNLSGVICDSSICTMLS